MKANHTSNQTIKISFWDFIVLRTKSQKPPFDLRWQTCSHICVDKGVVFEGARRKLVAGILSATSSILIATQSLAERTLKVEFEGPPLQPPETAFRCTNYSEHLVSFTGDFVRRGASTNELWPVNPSTYVQDPVGFVRCSRYGNQSFRLASVDLAGFSIADSNSPATFEGYRADGSIVMTNFPVHGIVFTTCEFSQEFSNLTNVLIQAGAMDNLKMEVASIPPVLRLRTNGYSGYSWLVLTVSGTTEVPYRLEYTDILPTTNWTTFTNFQTFFYLTIDLPVTNPPQRFFRAVELP